MKRFQLFFARMVACTMLASFFSNPSNADVSPKYPKKQYWRGIEGCILAESDITAKGKVSDVVVLKDHGNFIQAAKTFLWKLRYSVSENETGVSSYPLYIEYRLIDPSITDEAGNPILTNFKCPFAPTDDTKRIVVYGRGKWIENRDGTSSWKPH